MKYTYRTHTPRANPTYHGHATPYWANHASTLRAQGVPVNHRYSFAFLIVIS